MSKAKNAARLEAEARVARRRQGAAHRALRSRATRGKGARSDASPAAEAAAQHPPTAELATPTWLAAESDNPELGAAAASAATPSEPDATPDSRAVTRVSALAAAGAAANAARREDERKASEQEADAASTPDEPEAAPDDTAVLTTPVEETAVMSPAFAPRESAPASAWPATVDDVRTQAIVESAGGSSTSTGERGAHAKKRGRRWLAVPIVIIVLAGLYVGAQALLSGTVPRDTETLGVQIGGKSTGAALAAIDGAADELGAADITLTVESEGESVGMPAADAGLGIDAEATIQDLTGFTLRPERLWQHVTGGGHIDPVPTVDEDALDSAVADGAAELDRDAVDASVEIVGTAGVAHPGENSISVDADATAELVRDGWPTTTAVEAVATVEPPAITNEAAESFADDLSSQLLAGDVTLSSDNGDATITADQVAENSTVTTQEGTLALDIDGETIAADLVKKNPDLETEPEDASFTFTSSHQLKAEKSTDGVTVDGAALGDAITAAAQTQQRAGELPTKALEPDTSSDDIGVGDLKEIVASFDTPLTAEPVRTQNLRTAAADVEGTVVLSGEEFNLHDVLSPITEAEGYADAHVIVNGVLTDGIGGGLSQMATTSYNAAYFAGYTIEQFRPHSVWFTRYPAGRESTIWGTTINVRFTNDTPYAAVLNSYVEGGRLHVDIWSTKYYDVTTSASDKTNVKSPGVKEVSSANCQAKSAGQDGFTITNRRVVKHAGETVKDTSFTWTYQPDDAIKCVSSDD
ncbi:VanW family protein [Demequina sp. NBRC 110057]|uniref:VanW family protein n=1 Tax=Demequina sp. NBRC 110057 TaxID=1570346 RepID=UPI000A02183F|nr:VanW family protein [Demequina sp. NBRC 110057]